MHCVTIALTSSTWEVRHLCNPPRRAAVVKGTKIDFWVNGLARP